MGRGARMAVKWLLAPLAAGALGYAVVGPRLAGHKKLLQAVQERVGTIAPSIVPKPSEPTGMPAEDPAPSRPEPRRAEPHRIEPRRTEPSGETTAPRVTVTAKPAEEAPSDDPPRRRHRRRRRRIAHTEEAPPESAPSADREAPDPASTP